MLGADDGALAVEGARDAVRHHVLHLGMALAMLETLVGRGVDHGAGHRVRKMLLEASREAEHLRAVPAVERDDLGHLRGSRGERARLVEHDGICLGKRLKMFGALDGKALLGALAHGREHRDGARKLERAGVVDHERAARTNQVAHREPHTGREGEVPRHDLVGQMLATAESLGFERLGLLNQAHDRAHLGVVRGSAHAHVGLAVLNSGAGKDVVAHAAFHSERLAGER